MTATDFNQKTIDEFHAKQGRGVGPWGDNLVLMTARGASSGDQITTPLVCRQYGNEYVVAGSKGGAPDAPKWIENIRRNPVVDVEAPVEGGTEHFKATARVEAQGPERDRLYAAMAEVWPAFDDYEKKTTRKIPIAILTRQS